MALLGFGVVLILGASVGPVNARFALSRGGRQDYLYFRRDVNTSTPAGFFNGTAVTSQIHQNIPEVAFCTPRVYLEAKANDTSIHLGASDFAAEWTRGMGVARLDPALPGENLSAGLPLPACIVSSEWAETYQVVPGTRLHVTVPGLGVALPLHVTGIFDAVTGGFDDNTPYVSTSTLRLPLPEVVIDLRALWDRYPQYEARVNCLAITLEHSADYYDMEDYEGSGMRLRALAARINAVIGPTDWHVNYINYVEFEDSQEFLLAVYFITGFASLGTVVLCAILIYSSLSTATAETVREFGILRVLGARRQQVFWLVILQGGFVASVAVGIAVPVSIILSRFAVIPLMNLVLVNLWTVEMGTVVEPLALLAPVCVGFGTSLVVSLLPAVRAFRLTPVQALYPDRLLETGARQDRERLLAFEASREEHPRHVPEFHEAEKKPSGIPYVVAGVVITGTCLGFIFLIPDLVLYGGLFRFVNLLIALLFVTIVGLILLSLGVNARLLAGFVRAFKHLTGRLGEILRVGVLKHQRRNRTIGVMLVLSCSLTYFSLSFARRIGSLLVERIQVRYGADIRIVVPEELNWSFRADTPGDLMRIEGIESASSLSEARHIVDAARSGFHFDPNSSVSFTLSDLGGFQDKDVRILVIDEYYERTAFRTQRRMVEGDFERGFSSLFPATREEGEFNVLIGSRTAERLHLHAGNAARLSLDRNDGEIYQTHEARVTGVYETLPGLSSLGEELFMHEADYSIVVSRAQLIAKYGFSADIGADTLLVKLAREADPAAVMARLRDLIGPRISDCRVYVYADEVETERAMSFFGQVFTFAVFVVLLAMTISGLASATYSTFLERRHEFKIFRALGLSIEKVRRLLFLESLVVFLVNALVGFGIGFLTFLNFEELSYYVMGVHGEATSPFPLIFASLGIAALLLFVQIRRIFRKHVKQAVLTDIIRGER